MHGPRHACIRGIGKLVGHVRCPDEADAQSLRSAVLLDEFARPVGKRVTIVVEARTGNVLPLLQAACSRRVIAVPTTQVAARRCAGMLAWFLWQAG